jgi:hypothetical protein
VPPKHAVPYNHTAGITHMAVSELAHVPYTHTWPRVIHTMSRFLCSSGSSVARSSNSGCLPCVCVPSRHKHTTSCWADLWAHFRSHELHRHRCIQIWRAAGMCARTCSLRTKKWANGTGSRMPSNSALPNMRPVRGSERRVVNAGVAGAGGASFGAPITAGVAP